MTTIMKMAKVRTLFFVLCFLVTGVSVHAQGTDANVFGDVKSDKDGKHIPFVSIFLEGTTTGITTDHTGHYLLVNLPTGKHVLVAKSMGYETQKKKYCSRKRKNHRGKLCVEGGGNGP